MAGLNRLSLEIAGRMVEITVRRSPLARALSLRVDGVRGVVLVLPSRTRDADALKFLRGHQDWLAQRVGILPTDWVAADGGVLPLWGADHVIRHRPDARRGVWQETGEIHVSGDVDHLPRRLGDFVRGQARAILTAKAHDLASRLDRKPARVTVKDTVSRWGSCSSQGVIALSWRLALAPAWVGEYVVGHEVAHLVELNHSPAFWALVAGLGLDHHAARSWLRSHGARLHTYRLG